MRALPILIALLFLVAIVGLGVAAIVYGVTSDSPGFLVVGVALSGGTVIGGLMAWRRTRQVGRAT